MSIFVLFSFIANAQEKQAAIDTSYFKTNNPERNLIESIIKDQVPATLMLLDRGVSANTKSSITGNSALIYAVEQGNMEIIEALVKAGANVNFKGFEGSTPLFMAIFQNDFQTAKYLLEQGADPNVKDDYGVTPLIYAAATNQYQSADLLIFYHADEKVTDKNENDPLIAAVTFENIETTDVLLQNSLNPNVQDNKGNTPAIITTQRGNYDILDLLLDFNADVNIPNNIGYTPLAYALTYNDVRASKLLVENGADVNHEVEKGRNMMDLARVAGNDTLIRLIKDNGGEILPGLDFSEVDFCFGNSFNSSDYFMNFRGALVDTKRGYFLETGVDYRPFLLRVQREFNDTLFQLREKRIGWSHSIGKYQTLVKFRSGVQLSAYGTITGYLSFPRYPGYISAPKTSYKIIPSAGLALRGRYIGLKAGADWYNFADKLDKGLKANVTVFFRISYPETHFDRKEIYWE